MAEPRQAKKKASSVQDRRSRDRGGQDLARTGGAKAERKLKAREQRERNLFFGLGMFGLVGFSVAVPTLAGALLGLWLDHTYPRPRLSWTLSLLAAGLIVGCVNAWRWVVRESRSDQDE